MVADKYIGMFLAILSSFAIGASSICQKMGLNDVARRAGTSGKSASDGFSYLRNSIWWSGSALMIIGEIANFAAYTFAPPILVTPLGALSVIIAAILASYVLKEHLGHVGRVGCMLCLLGSVIIVLHAPADKDVQTVDEIMAYALRPAFLLYCLAVLVFTVYMIYYVSPVHGASNPLVWISMCSFVASIGIMCIKGFGIALKLTLEGHNQFYSLSTYVLATVAVSCLLLQMYYYTKALDRFTTTVVNPIYYVCFSTATIVASLILFRGFNTTDGTSIASLLAGFAITFLGVHLLDHARGAPGPGDAGYGELNAALEEHHAGGVMRSAGAVPASGWPAKGDGLFRAQSSALLSAFELDDERDRDRDREREREEEGLRVRRWSADSTPPR